LLNEDGRRIEKMVQRRKFKLLIDDAPTALRTALTRDGVVEVSWTNVKSYVYDKIAMRTE
jgi:hypothetical protein